MAIFTYDVLRQTTALATSAVGTAGNVLVNFSGIKYVRTIIIHNTDTSARTISFYLVPNSNTTTPTDHNHRFWHGTINPDSTIMIEIPTPGIILKNTNDTIKGICDVANKVSCAIYGGTE